MPWGGRDGLMKRQAFTLIELLVVIAVIALLLSILTPSLREAKELARTTVCQSNMKQLGRAGLEFAADNEGRGPGSAHRDIPSNSSIAWQNILNHVHYEEDLVERRAATYDSKKLSCPSLKDWGGSPSVFAWNLDAAGGPTWGSNPPGGPYGQVISDPRAINPAWDFYRLGALLERFTQISYKFLCIERERANDYLYGGASSPHYDVVLGGGGTHGYPPWTDAYGLFSFRHKLRGNFLFFDTHVETLGPGEEINSAERIKMEP